LAYHLEGITAPPRCSKSFLIIIPFSPSKFDIIDLNFTSIEGRTRSLSLAIFDIG